MIVKVFRLRQHPLANRDSMQMISFGWMVFYLFLLYVGAGLVTAILFFFHGASKLAHNAPVTFGARVFFLPGAILLWPLILKRWLALGAAK